MARKPINLSAFESLPSVRSMGEMLFDPFWRRRTHGAKRCELMHVTEGRVELVLGGKRFAAGPGDLLLVPAGSRHRDDFEEARGLKVFMIFFDWQPARRYFAKVNNSVLARLPAERKAEIGGILSRLAADVSAQHAMDRLVASVRLHEILMILLREALSAEKPPREAGQRRRLMLQAREFLRAHYAEAISLDDIAAALGVSPFHLSHVFSEESDFTLFDYLTHLRMEKARELLATGQLKVSAVARAVGYDSGNYFAKVFRRHFGTAPSQLCPQ